MVWYYVAYKIRYIGMNFVCLPTHIYTNVYMQKFHV